MTFRFITVQDAQLTERRLHSKHLGVYAGHMGDCLLEAGFSDHWTKLSSHNLYWMVRIGTFDMIIRKWMPKR